MRLYNFVVTVKDESTLHKQVKKEFHNIVEYQFPANGAYFFMSERPVLTKETPGKAETKSHWIPTSKILNIEVTSDVKFDSLMDRKKFVDALV